PLLLIALVDVEDELLVAFGHVGLSEEVDEDHLAGVGGEVERGAVHGAGFESGLVADDDLGERWGSGEEQCESDVTDFHGPVPERTYRRPWILPYGGTDGGGGL